MKIYSLNSFNYSNNKNNKNNIQQSKNNTSFTAGWKVNKLNILGRNSEQLRDLAEYFHKSSDVELKDVATITNFLGIKKTESSNKAYNILLEAVEQVRKDKNSLLSKIANLSIGENKNKQNIADKKLFMIDQFFNPLKAEKDGAQIKIQNGILIHGTSREKQSFLEWIINTSKLNYNEINFDISDPVNSLKKIFQAAENAKLAKELNGQRTLLNLKNIDELLTDFDSIENRRNIAKFKNFTEHCANDYKTTVITTTDQILDNFEPASIAPHRFELKVELNEHLTDEEQRELSLLRDKVKKLDDKYNRARDEFYEYDLPETNNDKNWWEDPTEVYWRMG